MKLHFFDKPSGVTTHTSLSEAERQRVGVDPVDGFIEFLQSQSGRRLWAGHRLDVGTSGVLVATEDESTAARLATLFEGRETIKTYHFLSAQKMKQPEVEITSHIRRQGQKYLSYSGTSMEPNNALTRIFFEGELGPYYLYRAEPETGKPHQVRLHAEASGAAILGDTEHGGATFPQLMLHASELKLPTDSGTAVGQSPWSRLWRSQNQDALGSARLSRWILGIERRERLRRSLDLLDLQMRRSETWRWLHSEGGDLRIDQLGEFFHFHWYGKDWRSEDRAEIDRLIEILGWPRDKIYLQRRGNRGAQPQNESFEMLPAQMPERWMAREDELHFWFRRDSGLSAGLFLDQRSNRRWLQAHARDKRVLNLFAYTGGFSVAAAKGGAAQVVSVDLSAKFLEWAKENFAANQLDASALNADGSARYEFRAIETRAYLAWAKKQGLRFDFIICDPPSFARTEKGVFRIETDFDALVAECVNLLEPGGRLLLCSNYEAWTTAKWWQQLQRLLPRLQSQWSPPGSRPAANAVPGSGRPKLRLQNPNSPDWDFELPREERALKCALIEVDMESHDT